MKVEVKDGKKQEDIEYPCLMVNEDGAIILFSDNNTGMRVRSGLGSEPGVYSDGWIMDGFKLFTGSITLSND